MNVLFNVSLNVLFEISKSEDKPKTLDFPRI